MKNFANFFFPKFYLLNRKRVVDTSTKINLIISKMADCSNFWKKSAIIHANLLYSTGYLYQMQTIKRELNRLWTNTRFAQLNQVKSIDRPFVLYRNYAIELSQIIQSIALIMHFCSSSYFRKSVCNIIHQISKSKSTDDSIRKTNVSCLENFS